MVHSGRLQLPLRLKAFAIVHEDMMQVRCVLTFCSPVFASCSEMQ